MKPYLFSFALFVGTSAYAGLADQYDARSSQKGAAAREARESNAYSGALRFVQKEGRSKIVSGPEVRETERMNYYFYQMANGKICRLPVSRNSEPWYFIDAIWCE